MDRERSECQSFASYATFSSSGGCSEDDPNDLVEISPEECLLSSSVLSSFTLLHSPIPDSRLISSDGLSHEHEKAALMQVNHQEVLVEEARENGEPTTDSASGSPHGGSSNKATEPGEGGGNIPIYVDTAHSVHSIKSWLAGSVPGQAQSPSSSSGSDISRGGSSQHQLPFPSLQQETGEHADTLQFWCCRKKILKSVVDKSSRSLSTQHMRVTIPTTFSPRYPSYARLTLHFTPYVAELTKWPMRFCRLSLHLKIPRRYVNPLTVNHTCLLALAVHVSSSTLLGERNDLLDERCPLKFSFPVSEGKSELEQAHIRTVLQTTLFDATCKYVKFEICAKFDLEPVAIGYHALDPHDADGFVEIVQNECPSQ